MLLEHSENILAAALGVAVDACERLQPDSHLVAIAKFLAKGGEESGLLTKSGCLRPLQQRHPDGQLCIYLQRSERPRPFDDGKEYLW